MVSVAVRTVGLFSLLLVVGVRNPSAATLPALSNTPVADSSVAETSVAETPAAEPTASVSDLSALEAATAAAGLDSDVLREALRARHAVVASEETASTLLTVIDYGLPSRMRRLWVIDLATDSVLAHELVAHGKNSGGDIATSFSNRRGSNQSSLGTFVTGNTYHGKHGLSLRLHGLDAGVNDAAFDRAIVIHGAAYVRESIVPQLGRLGRSQGCPALAEDVAPRVIDLIKDGTVVYAAGGK